MTMRQRRSRTKARALAAFLAATAVAGVGVLPAAPAFAQQVRSYSIPAAPLADVLNRYAREAGLELAYPAELTAALSSSGLNGSYGAAEGLSRILAGTGISFRQTGARAFTLERIQ